MRINLQLHSDGIKNLDNPEAKTEDEIRNEMIQTIQNGDAEGFSNAQLLLAKNIEKRILEDAKNAVNENINDNAVMVKRGLNPLTSEERKFYNEVISAGGFAGVEQLMPATIFDRIFEYLRTEHPLLSEIDFVNTTGVTEWIIREGDAEAAWWGTLCDEVKKKLESAFKIESTGLYKLSAFVPVCKAMLDLGPTWLDRFVRELLAESIAIALEDAVVNGDGNGKPIGMTKDLKGSVVEGVYPDKTPVTLTDFNPETLGKEVMSPLTLGGKRAVNNVLLIVNPDDYWGKIFGLTTMLTANKEYVYGVLPIPGRIIQSVAVKKGNMVAGMAKDYFMGIGSTRKIGYSDHYKFLEDERTYLAKQYANGYPKINDGFIVFDISNLGNKEPVA